MKGFMTYEMEKIEQLTTHAIKRVFQEMLSMEVTIDTAVPEIANPSMQIAGSVGFIGEGSGVIYLYSSLELARLITSRMLSVPEGEVDSDEMVNDAVGEIANMVGGSVKSSLADAGYPCTLTIPSIVRGQYLTVEGMNDVTRQILAFRADEHQLFVELLIKESSPV